MDFRDIIRKAREGRGLSREAVARRISVNAATVAAWEYGHKDPPGDARLTDLAKVLRLPVRDVVDAACRARPYLRLPCETHAERDLASALFVWLADATDESRYSLAAALRVSKDASPRP